VVLYIFLVAVLNLSVGFTVALYLGRQYRELLALAEASPWQAEAPRVLASTPVDSSLFADPTEEHSLLNEPLGLVEAEAEIPLGEQTGLTASLDKWRQEDPQGTRQLNAAMLDIDGFAKLNDRYGRDVCDRILQAITGLLEAESRSHTLEGRFSGQRFLLLFPDVDLQFTINVVERIRQTLEKARFNYQKEEIKVTASCAVGELMPEDTPETLHARVEETLYQAKRYKGNRTFVNEGKYPTPVVPPTLDLQEKSIPI